MGYWQGDLYIEDPVMPKPDMGTWDGFWQANSGGGGSSKTIPALAQQLGMTPEQYFQWASQYNQRTGGNPDSAASMRQFALDMGMGPAQAEQLAQQSASSFSDWQGQQANLNKDHGLGTFLALLAAGVGGGALLAGGFGAGVGANAAGAMGIEAGAAGAGGAGLGLGAGEGLVGWDALGNAAAGGLGEVGSLAGNAAAGGGMDVWDLMGNLDMYGLGDPYSMGADAWSFGPGNIGESAWDFGPGNIGDIGTSGWNNDMASLLGSGNSSWTDLLKNYGSSAVKSLLSGFGGSSDATGGLLGGLLGGSSSDWLGKSLGLAPILGGLAYAYDKAGPDLNKLNSLYDQYNPEGNLGLYDLNTEYGRRDLMSGLARRGVAGSSFGNADIYNYNTTRDIGRSAALNTGVMGAANIANSIAGWEAAENKNKTDLIGRGLYSIGTLFGGR